MERILTFASVIVTIEVCIPAPFVMYVAGWDGLGTLFTYLALFACLISQVTIKIPANVLIPTLPRYPRDFFGDFGLSW